MISSELRIGNYIKGIGIKPTWIIEGIKGDLIYSLDEWRLLNSFEPIPLTEEWLLKFGFKEYIDFGYKTKQFDLLPLQGFSYNIDKKKVMVMHKCNSQSHWLKNSIEYVHQLQNLYFALTGEELKTK